MTTGKEKRKEQTQKKSAQTKQTETKTFSRVCCGRSLFGRTKERIDDNNEGETITTTQ